MTRPVFHYWICCLLTAITASALSLTSAAAGTAYFTSDAEILTDADYQTLSSANSDPYLIGSGDTLFIELQDPFATSSANELLTLYYTNGGNRRRSIGINFGYELNGVMQWAFTRPQFFNVRGSGSISIFGFSNFCSVAGGCTFISLTGGQRGNGFGLDAVAVNGQILSAAAPTPEPGIWSLMIAGFILVGVKLKHDKRQLGSSALPVPA